MYLIHLRPRPSHCTMEYNPKFKILLVTFRSLYTTCSLLPVHLALPAVIQPCCSFCCCCSYSQTVTILLLLLVGLGFFALESLYLWLIHPLLLFSYLSIAYFFSASGSAFKCHFLRQCSWLLFLQLQYTTSATITPLQHLQQPDIVPTIWLFTLAQSLHLGKHKLQRSCDSVYLFHCCMPPPLHLEHFLACTWQ